MRDNRKKIENMKQINKKYRSKGKMHTLQIHFSHADVGLIVLNYNFKTKHHRKFTTGDHDKNFFFFQFSLSMHFV